MASASSQIWSTSLIQYNEVVEYAGVCVCPCMYFEKIYSNLVMENVDRAERNDLASTAVSWIWSFFVDLPVIFCLASSRQRALHAMNGSDLNELEEGEDEWDPHSSSFDWWPLSWLAFYSTASCEYLCSCLCCGPQVHGARFPMCFTCGMALIYPCCTLPLSFLFRQSVKQRYRIQESCPETLIISAFCMPCSIKQVSETVETFTTKPSVSTRPIRPTNSMFFAPPFRMPAI